MSPSSLVDQPQQQNQEWKEWYGKTRVTSYELQVERLKAGVDS